MNKNIPGAIIIEGHVQGLSNTRSLGEAGIPVYVVDKTNCIARYSKFCEKFFRCPDFIEDSFADFLLELAEKESLKDWVLIPSNDHAVFTIAKHKVSLEEHYKVITPSSDIINDIYDKSRLIKIAEDNRIPVPATYSIGVNANINMPESNYPVLLKGRFGLSFYKTFKKKAFLARNEDELRNILTSIRGLVDNDDILVQELIPSDGSNKTVSFTAFSVNGEIKAYWMGVKVREHPLEFGTATFTRSIYIRECYKQSIPLLKAINYSGVCEIEYLLDPKDNKYKLIEINARTWLWVGLAKACGVDYAKMIYDYVNNQKIIYPKDYLIGLNWINPVTDLFFSLLAILQRKIEFLDYIKMFHGHKTCNAITYKGDNRPLLIYLLHIFSYLKTR